MIGKFETRLAELGVTLANAPAPAANYVPYVQVGNLVFVSGQISQDANGFITGKLGDNMSTEAGAVAAPTAGLHFDDALLGDLKSKGVETATITLHVGAGTFPDFVAVAHEHDVVANFEHGIHIMGVHHRGHAEIVRNLLDQLVNYHRRLGIETGIGFVAEQILWIQHNGAGYGHALLHSA